ncbi:MAG: DUF4062 domain-containing protein [Chloroflexota bacterium]|nr:DUF4062 domain-containing protein [Chloroflexota bacterium]
MAHVIKAMISSTALDLEEHRKAAMDACLSLRMLPVMMEHLPASATHAIEASLKMVDESDIFIGIIANRYGYIPDGHAQSITEMEYERAAARGIPVFLFLMRDSYLAMQPEIESADKAARLDDFKQRLQERHVVSPFTSPDNLRANLVTSLTQQLPDLAGRYDAQRLTEARQFTPTLREQFAQAHKTIEALTADQYAMMQALRYQRRMAIAGCAGSGKTLLAADKAIRLDESGQRTLILCHSRYLAQHIRTLTQGTGVKVNYFTAWVHSILGQQASPGSDVWSHFEEPGDAEIEAAFDNLVASNERYDAIIVDEGQDFREEWWLLVEAALRSPETSILYVFHDDNQALLPYRSKYPLIESPMVLSKNCRNAGAVFEVVRRFHPQAPDPTLGLQKMGVAKKWIYERGFEMPALKAALTEMSVVMPREKLVVLTTEPDPIEETLLYRSRLELPLAIARWQDFVVQYLNQFARFDTPLSDGETPTDSDVQVVMRFASAHYPAIWESPDKLRKKHNWTWVESNGGLTVRGSYRLGYFLTPQWAAELPKPQTRTYTLTQTDSIAENEIRFFTVSAYKGLESDGVILFIPAPQAELAAITYVGASRARLALHIVAEKSALKHVPYMRAVWD